MKPSLAIFIAAGIGWLSAGSCAWAQAVVEIEINDTAADADDYITWCPISARARLVAIGADKAVTLSSTKRPATGNSGEVVFAPFTATRPTPATFNHAETLALTLPGSRAWKPFWVAGKKSSADGKDVKIVVKESSGGPTLAEHPLMVRVRKNAESLTALEAERFLRAVATLHDLEHQGAASKYLKYVHVHGEAFFVGIHGVPSFAAWHRTMLLAFERELQQIDARVALPYWKFDENAPKTFTLDFMGTVPGTGPAQSVVTFTGSNPINQWKMPLASEIEAMTVGGPIPLSTQPLIRVRNAATTHPSVALNTVLNKAEYSLMNDFLEPNYHNSAHSHISGWLGDVQSPKDPLFFLLHANVDRAWALWQKNKNAFNANATLAYSPQGGYPGVSAAFHQGSYANDTQWPWDLRGGNQGTTDPGDDWPAFEFGLPLSPPNHGPSTLPITKELVDYMDAMGDGFLHGYCYDTISWN